MKYIIQSKPDEWSIQNYPMYQDGKDHSQTNYMDDCCDALKRHHQSSKSNFLSLIHTEFEGSDSEELTNPDDICGMQDDFQIDISNIQMIQDQLIAIKTTLCEGKYHTGRFDDVCKKLGDIRKDVYITLINIALGLRRCGNENEEVGQYKAVSKILNEINKMDDAISHMIFTWENGDAIQIGGWQWDKHIRTKIRDIFNAIEDCFFYIKSNVDWWLETRKLPSSIDFGVKKYPDTHLLDVVAVDQWGNILVLHKSSGIEDAVNWVNHYKDESEFIGVAICEPMEYNLEKFFHSKETNIPKRKSFPDAFKKELHKWQDGKCACCKDKVAIKKMHEDHITPLASGGLDQESNIQLLCKECNLTKSWKPIHNVHLYKIVMEKRKNR